MLAINKFITKYFLVKTISMVTLVINMYHLYPFQANSIIQIILKYIKTTKYTTRIIGLCELYKN